MCVVANKGLRCGSYNGVEYVFGAPKEGSFEEIVRAFPSAYDPVQQIRAYNDTHIGNIYVKCNTGENPVIPVDAIQYMRDEFYKECYEWFEFEDFHTFVDYMMLCKNMDSSTKLYMDKRKGEYYARRSGIQVGKVSDFAVSVDINMTFALEMNESLIEVKWKEEKN